MTESAQRDNCIQLPNFDIHNCFGCSPRNAKGMHMEFYLNEKKDTVISWYSVPEHLCGWANVVHGGIVSTMLDEAMGWACVALLKKMLLSKSIAVDFYKPIMTEEEIKVAGSVLKIKSEREAVLKGIIFDRHDKICAQSTSVVSLFSMEDIRKLGVMDEEMINKLERSWELL
ncbi:PaaI family thioesterase [Thermodesulfobacteriota bacterium]